MKIQAGKPVSIGGVSLRVPDTVVLEEEIETQDGETELEFELKWPVPAVRSSNRSTRGSPQQRKSRRTS